MHVSINFGPFRYDRPRLQTAPSRPAPPLHVDVRQGKIIVVSQVKGKR